MVTGESGTGKELIARALFKNSLRVNKPFIPVNCAAIPENLIESELFGHEKGAFTGAADRRIGKFEQCDGGTIFLDEIGDMALPTQTKILRALQEGEIQRVGSSGTIKVNVRMLAATNKSLEAMVAEKTFREDLYYRLNVVRIQIPPLRERMEDVPQLINFVLKRLASDSKASTQSISPEALEILSCYQWPGNVRELENIVYSSAVMAQGDSILIKDLPQEVIDSVGEIPVPAIEEKANTNESMPVEEAVLGTPLLSPLEGLYQKLREEHGNNILEHAERAIIAKALTESGGKLVPAAEILGMTRATLRKRIDQYGLA